MKRLVTDTGPLLHLHEAGALRLMPLVGVTLVSPVVRSELSAHAPTLWSAGVPGWVELARPSADAQERGLRWVQAGLLQRGEAEALALAVEERPDWFLTDDAAARLMAESLGLQAHGSLGVLLWAAANQVVGRTEAEGYLAALEASSLWMSPRVRAEARVALASLFRSG